MTNRKLALAFLPLLSGVVAGQANPYTAAAVRGDLELSSRLSGEVVANDPVPVSSRLSEPAVLLHLVEGGRTVETGDLVVELDDSELREQLEGQRVRELRVRADLSVAAAAVESAERAVELFGARQRLAEGKSQLEELRVREDSAMPESEATLALEVIAFQRRVAALDRDVEGRRLRAEVEASGLRHQAAKLAVERCRREQGRLGNAIAACRIAAPRAGVVVTPFRRPAEIGDRVHPRQVIAHIADPADTRVSFQLPADRVGFAAVGTTLLVASPLHPTQRLTATIVDIADRPRLASGWSRGERVIIEGGVFEVRAELTETPDRRLPVGLMVIVDLALKPMTGVVLVPVHAVSTDRRSAYCTIVTDDGQLLRRDVVAGPDDGTLRVVHEGLEPGDVVVVAEELR